jgi:hypothetical protein
MPFTERIKSVCFFLSEIQDWIKSDFSSVCIQTSHKNLFYISNFKVAEIVYLSETMHFHELGLCITEALKAGTNCGESIIDNKILIHLHTQLPSRTFCQVGLRSTGLQLNFWDI